MRALLPYASKISAYEARSIVRIAPRSSKLQASSTVPRFICVQCRFRTSIASPKIRLLHSRFDRRWLLQATRQFSSRASHRKDGKPQEATPVPEAPNFILKDSIELPAPEAPESTVNDSTEASNHPHPPRIERPKVHRVPDEELPSYRERMRSQLGKRFHELMDDLMPKLALASQKINNYTGTDYSGIAALRKEIIEQGI
jgi:sensitive to high expression protein 9